MKGLPCFFFKLELRKLGGDIPQHVGYPRNSNVQATFWRVKHFKIISMRHEIKLNYKIEMVRLPFRDWLNVSLLSIDSTIFLILALQIL